MKAVHRMSVGAILWLALALAIPSTLAQNTFDDSAMRRDTATRIRQTHGISMNWQQKSLLELMDSEARLSAVKRIKEEHGVQFDWQKTPLLTLMDAEARMNAAKRISQATKKPVDWKKYTLLQLMETEARLSGVDVDAMKKEAARRAAAGGASAAPSGSAIETKVDGEFNGWEGETIVKLMNGQIWQQTEYYYHYHYAYMPDVILYNSGGGWKMKVEGVDKAVRVQKLK